MASVTPTGTGSNHQSEVQTESVRSANQKFNPSFDRDGMPLSMRWDYQDVADWIEFLGFRQYRVIMFIVQLCGGLQIDFLPSSILFQLVLVFYKQNDEMKNN